MQKNVMQVLFLPSAFGCCASWCRTK